MFLIFLGFGRGFFFDLFFVLILLGCENSLVFVFLDWFCFFGIGGIGGGGIEGNGCGDIEGFFGELCLDCGKIIFVVVVVVNE